MYVERLFLRDGEAVGWFRHKINFRYLDFPKSHLGEGGGMLFSSEPSAVSHYIFHAVYFVLSCCEEFYCFGAAEWKLGWADKKSPIIFFFILRLLCFFFISWLFSPFASLSRSFVSFMVKMGHGCVSMFCFCYRVISIAKKYFVLLLLSSLLSFFLFTQEVPWSMYQLFRNTHIPWN